MRRFRIISVLYVVSAIAAGCRGDVAGSAFQLYDSAGVRVAFSPAPLDPTPRAIGAVDVGVVGETPPLSDVVGALRLSDGRIVVADGGGPALHYYSAEGAPIASVGRPGDGPSEFRILQAIGRLPGDTVWAYDFSLNRFSFIGPDARVARTVTLRPPVGPGLAVGVLTSGDLLVGESWSPAAMAAAAEPGLTRAPVAYLRYAPDGSLADTVAMAPGREVWLTLEDGRPVMGTAPLGRSTVHALEGDRLLLGEQIGHEVRTVSPSAGAGIVRWAGADLSVTPEVEDAWREARLAGLEPRERARFQRSVAELEFPDLLPAYQEILSTPDGGFWIGSYEPDGGASRQWQVFDAVGRWLATMSAPARFRVLEVRPDGVLGVWTDELDVPRVESRRIDPFGPRDR